MKGSLHKKGNYYYVVISLKDEFGKYIKKWISTKTGDEREAKRRMKKILKDVSQNLITFKSKNNDRLKFHELMEIWLRDVIKFQVEDTTYQGYCINIRTHIIPYFKELNVNVEDLTTSDIELYIKFKYLKGRIDKKGGISASYVKKHYYNIRSALEYAIDKLNIIEKNPAKIVTLPKGEEYIHSYYEIEQLEKVLEITKNTAIEAAVFMALHYGLRRGEVLGLRWKDIDFKRGCFTIRNQRTRVSSQVEKKPKSISSRRTLPLMECVKEYLNEIKSQQKNNKKFFGKAYDDNDLICIYADGKPLSIHTLNHTFSKLLEKNDMPHIRFHDLRHSIASYLIKIGVSMKEIQLWLGHADMWITSKYYTHLEYESKFNSANKINEQFNKKRK
ncbi:MAG: site-specific integrase [Clostridiales bacterium]